MRHEFSDEIIVETVNRFRYHRPTIDALSIASPVHYREYDIEAAAFDTLIKHGLGEPDLLKAKDKLAGSAIDEIDNYDLIVDRRMALANKMKSLALRG